MNIDELQDLKDWFQYTSTIFFMPLKKIQAMGHDAIKLELIQWLSRLEDDDTLN